MNRIRHNSPSPIQCLRAFHILFFAYLLFRCYCYNHYKTQKYYFCYRYRYFHITLLLNTLLQILSYPGVVELTTQLLILENILWLPCVKSINLGWILYPRKLPRSHALVGYCKTISNCWAIGSSSLLTPLPWRHQVGNSCTSTTFFWSHCQGTAIIIFLAPLSGRGLLYSRSHLGFISADHYEESERSKNQSLALNYEGR